MTLTARYLQAAQELEDEEDSLLSLSMDTEPDDAPDKRTRTAGAGGGSCTGTMYDKYVPIRVQEIFKEQDDEISYEVEMEFQTITAMPAYEVSMEQIVITDHFARTNQRFCAIFSTQTPMKLSPRFQTNPPHPTEPHIINQSVYNGSY